jgi:hypothetical protein
LQNWRSLAWSTTTPTAWREQCHFRQECDPNKFAGARSFQFGLASAPIAPQTVQTMRGLKDGAPVALAPAAHIAERMF